MRTQALKDFPCCPTLGKCPPKALIILCVISWGGFQVCESTLQALETLPSWMPLPWHGLPQESGQEEGEELGPRLQVSCPRWSPWGCWESHVVLCLCLVFVYRHS